MSNYYKPFFSVLIPNYGKNDFLFQSINSACDQTTNGLFSYEIIICDQNNNNIFSEIKDKVSNIFSELNVNGSIFQYEIKSLYLARHELMKRAKGKYIVFLDSDDFLNKDYLINIFFDLERGNLPDILINPLIESDLNCIPLEKENKKYFEIFKSSNKDDYFWFGYNINSVVMKIFKRELYNISDYNESFNKVTIGEDRVFSYYIFKKAKNIWFCQKPCGYYYRQDPKSMIHNLRFIDSLNAFQNNNLLSKLPENVHQKKILYQSNLSFLCSSISALVKNNRITYKEFKLLVLEFASFNKKNKLNFLYSKFSLLFIVGFLIDIHLYIFLFFLFKQKIKIKP